jgi:soluble lytic murein transglycosylase
LKVSFFVLLFSLGFSSCAAAQSGVEFYEGLKKRQDGTLAEAAACFEKALNADNPHIAAAASAELMKLHADGFEIHAGVMSAVRRKAAGSWARALDLIDVFEKPPQKQAEIEICREKFLTLLLTGEGRSVDEAVHYIQQKWRDDSTGGIPLAEAEKAVIDGRIAASRSRYNEALLFFRIALDESPGLFFRYPDLLTDLGRTFQYTASGRAGIDLYLEWEKIISGNDNAEEREIALRKAIPDGGENLVRFRLLFFAARIARQRGEKNIELFEKALPFAREVSPEQSDACIWYILDSALGLPAKESGGAAQMIQYLEKYIPQWHDDAYFFDVMDKLAREFILKRQWKNIANVFELLKNRSGAATAQYAWICGRLIEEGLSPSEESAAAYMRGAYNAGNRAWYYRSRAAAALGEPFLVLPEDTPLVKTAKTKPAKGKSADPDESDAMQFLLGFFGHNAAQFAARHIRAMESDLSVDELYSVAGAFNASGQYQESIRLVSLYSRRGDYQIKRKDLELLYPRPFREIVELYAEETGLEPPLLFGLIRTESAFDSNAISRAGAAGLTQLMPATAEEMALRIRRQGGPDYIQTNADETMPISIDLHDPAVNIHIGAVYLAYLNGQMEDALIALLAYNGGINRVRSWCRAANRSAANLPPDLFSETVEYTETRNYGRSVMGSSAMYKELYYSTENN